MLLKPGDKGTEVELLQIKLKACGYDPGSVDGDYGKKTTAAVLAFQMDRPDVDDDGVAGPHTLGAIDMALDKIKAASDVSAPPNQYVQCNDQTWLAFQALVTAVTGKPVRYGPGRGLWVDGKFVITYGAGKLGGTVQQWPNVLGRPYPSFHCTSWTNFFMSWLCRRNQDFTHAGNIPSLFDLLEGSPDLHKDTASGVMVRGFGDVCFRLPVDGSGSKRLGISNVVDARELLERKDQLPSFIVCGQSTKLSTGWKWWHHTVLFAVRDHKLFRIAADGMKGPNGYSAQAMRWLEITTANVGNFANVAYRPYGVRAADDGSYGDQSRSIASVSFEG
jgi:peptidoglycan hydrolase-like protein with peptidoglycan-binding domain